jgi:hypothetical protein
MPEGGGFLVYRATQIQGINYALGLQLENLPHRILEFMLVYLTGTMKVDGETE